MIPLCFASLPFHKLKQLNMSIMKLKLKKKKLFDLTKLSEGLFDFKNSINGCFLPKMLFFGQKMT